MNLEEKKFSELLKKLIEFKSGVTKIPIKDLGWEELIWATLLFMYGDEKVKWNPQSHNKSVDIVAEIDQNKECKISAKAGKISTKKNKFFLTISSYRLTSFNSLNDMLDFIKNQHNSFDYYLICARQNKKEQVKYIAYKIKSTRLAPEWFLKSQNWQENNSGYELKNSFEFEAKIVKKMSNQLWYYIPLTYFSDDEKMLEIGINKDELGRNLIDFLRKEQKDKN
ncbi:MAG: hypothetical protein QW134_09615 [Nitrososphaeria archaeon]